MITRRIKIRRRRHQRVDEYKMKPKKKRIRLQMARYTVKQGYRSDSQYI